MDATNCSSSYSTSNSRRRGWTGLVPVALAGLALAGSPGSVQAAELAGSWSGGGTVSFLSGSNEKARCRATYVKKSPVVYGVTAACATASGRVSQSARLKKVGPNSYSGSFYNAEYETSGTFYVAVRGNRQNVSINATKGSARMSLSR